MSYQLVWLMLFAGTAAVSESNLSKLSRRWRNAEQVDNKEPLMNYSMNIVFVLDRSNRVDSSQMANVQRELSSFIERSIVFGDREINAALISYASEVTVDVGFTSNSSELGRQLQPKSPDRNDWGNSVEDALQKAALLAANSSRIGVPGLIVLIFRDDNARHLRKLVLSDQLFMATFALTNVQKSNGTPDQFRQSFLLEYSIDGDRTLAVQLRQFVKDLPAQLCQQPRSICRFYDNANTDCRPSWWWPSGVRPWSCFSAQQQPQVGQCQKSDCQQACNKYWPFAEHSCQQNCIDNELERQGMQSLWPEVFGECRRRVNCSEICPVGNTAAFTGNNGDSWLTVRNSTSISESDSKRPVLPISSVGIASFGASTTSAANANYTQSIEVTVRTGDHHQPNGESSFFSNLRANASLSIESTTPRITVKQFVVSNTKTSNNPETYPYQSNYAINKPTDPAATLASTIQISEAMKSTAQGLVPVRSTESDAIPASAPDHSQRIEESPVLLQSPGRESTTQKSSNTPSVFSGNSVDPCKTGGIFGCPGPTAKQFTNRDSNQLVQSAIQTTDSTVRRDLGIVKKSTFPTWSPRRFTDSSFYPRKTNIIKLFGIASANRRNDTNTVYSNIGDDSQLFRNNNTTTYESGHISRRLFPVDPTHTGDNTVPPDTKTTKKGDFEPTDLVAGGIDNPDVSTPAEDSSNGSKIERLNEAILRVYAGEEDKLLHEHDYDNHEQNDVPNFNREHGRTFGIILIVVASVLFVVDLVLVGFVIKYFLLRKREQKQPNDGEPASLFEFNNKSLDRSISSLDMSSLPSLDTSDEDLSLKPSLKQTIFP